MTRAQEKANELANRMYDGSVFNKTKEQHIVECSKAKDRAKIVIDELLIFITAIDGKEFWQEHFEEVKEEIEKL